MPITARDTRSRKRTHLTSGTPLGDGTTDPNHSRQNNTFLVRQRHFVLDAWWEKKVLQNRYQGLYGLFDPVEVIGADADIVSKSNAVGYLHHQVGLANNQISTTVRNFFENLFKKTRNIEPTTSVIVFARSAIHLFLDFSLASAFNDRCHTFQYKKERLPCWTSDLTRFFGHDDVMRSLSSSVAHFCMMLCANSCIDADRAPPFNISCRRSTHESMSCGSLSSIVGLPAASFSCVDP